MTERREIELRKVNREISAIEEKLNHLHQKHIKAMMAGSVTRARTTTYNAHTGQLAQQLDILREQKKRLEETAST